MADATSLTLLNRVQDALDDDAWSRFDAIYRTFVVRFLSSRAVDPDIAEDICQNVMKQVYEALSSGRFQHNGRTGAFRNWLRQIMVTQLALQRRKASRDEYSLPADLDQQLSKDDSRLVKLWDREHDQAMLHAILELLRGKTPPDSFEIFRQTFVEGRPAEQVADQFGRTKNAVVVTKCKLLKTARQLAQELSE